MQHEEVSRMSKLWQSAWNLSKQFNKLKNNSFISEGLASDLDYDKNTIGRFDKILFFKVL